MPFDARTYTAPSVTDDPFSLESFVAWAQKQDPAETYSYYQPDRCLLSRYFGEPAGRTCDGRFIVYRGHDLGNSPLETIAITEPWTIGDALSRARALQSSKG